MLRRIVYSLYLFSKERGKGNDYLMSGASAFFLLFMNLMTILIIGFWLFDKPFGTFFIEYEFLFIALIVIGFFSSQYLAHKVVKKIEENKIVVKEIKIASILLYAIISLAALLLSMLLIKR